MVVPQGNARFNFDGRDYAQDERVRGGQKDSGRRFLDTNPVYQFLDRKRAEGKPYLVYMTAGANKFLRIYYGKVKECLRNLEQESNEES